jgi:hypothetical protein
VHLTCWSVAAEDEVGVAAAQVAGQMAGQAGFVVLQAPAVGLMGKSPEVSEVPQVTRSAGMQLPDP